MIWFLVIHIIAILFWCAALLYIPALVAVNYSTGDVLVAPAKRGSMARFIFTNISSPAALLAIVAGTAVFLLGYKVEFWLVVKLSLVTCLVILHALTGLFLLGVDSDPQKPVLLKCTSLGGGTVFLMACIIFIVLAKPDVPFGLEVFQ